MPFHVLFGGAERSSNQESRVASASSMRLVVVGATSILIAFHSDAIRALPFRLQLDILLDRSLPVSSSRTCSCQKPDPV